MNSYDDTTTTTTELANLRCAAEVVAAARNSGDGTVEACDIDALSDAAFAVLNATKPEGGPSHA